MDLKQDKKEKYEYKTAKQMKELADQENTKSLDIEKETKRTLKKVLDAVEIMAQKGDCSISYMCNKAEASVVGNVIQELQNLGFRIEVLELSGTKVISIKWDLKDNVEEENNN